MLSHIFFYFEPFLYGRLGHGAIDFWILNFFNIQKDTAPVKLPTRYCLRAVFPHRLDLAQLKTAVSLLSPRKPKSPLQPLTATLRINRTKSIPSYSKASGVFSSTCR